MSKNPQFENKKFSVVYSSKKYNANFDEAFGRKYFLSFIEEFWPKQMDNTYIGRVEVYADEANTPYAIEEIRFAFADYNKYSTVRKKWDFIRVTKEKLEELRKLLDIESEKTTIEIKKRRK